MFVGAQSATYRISRMELTPLPGQDVKITTSKKGNESGKVGFMPLDIKGAATVSSTCIFNQESLPFPKWGEQTYHGVPFMVADPEGGKTKNVICLYSGLGAISSNMPKAVCLPYDSSANAIHFLGAAGWGVPWTDKGTMSMLVKLEYADGTTEDHPLLNGVHLTDWAKGPDVSGSKSIGVFQVRYFSVVPKRPDRVIRAINFRKGTDQTSPFVIAATIEGPATLLARAAEKRDRERQEAEKAERERKEALVKNEAGEKAEKLKIEAAEKAKKEAAEKAERERQEALAKKLAAEKTERERQETNARREADKEWREALAGAFSLKTKGQVNRVFFGKDGETFTSVGKGGVAHWSMTDRKLIRTITDKNVCDAECWYITPDGKRSATTTREKTVIWDLDQGKVIRTSPKTSPHGAGIFSPDGRFVALYTEKFDLSLVDLEVDKVVREIAKPKLDDCGFQFTPDGKRLVLYGGDYDPEWLRTRTVPRPGRGEIRAFDLGTGKEIGSYLGQDGPINRIAYSPDGTLLASVGWTTVRIWDVNTGKQLHSFNRAGPSWLRSTGCSFSPDSKFLANGNGNLLVVWNTATGQKVFDTDKAREDIVFSQDGKIAWSHDGLNIHDIASGQRVLTVKSAVPFWNLGFSPNGKLVAIGTEKGVVILPIPKIALETPPTLVLGADLGIKDSGSDRLTVKKLEPVPGARKLVAGVKTTSDENVDKMFTQHIQNLSVSATKSQIVIDFDVDRKNWQPVPQSVSLLVRVFDKDGKYLTHFVSKESFTASPDVHAGWTEVVNRLKQLPPQAQADMLGDFTPVLLEANGNRLIYNVNPTILSNGAIVEVGLIHIKKKAPF